MKYRRILAMFAISLDNTLVFGVEYDDMAFVALGRELHG